VKATLVVVKGSRFSNQQNVPAAQVSRGKTTPQRLNGRAEYEAEWANTVHERETIVFHRRGGKWVAVHEQLSPLPEARPPVKI